MQVHPITLPAFGVLIPNQGGHFAAIMRGAISGCVEQPPYALLVAPVSAGGEIEDVRWGEYSKLLEDATDRRDGLSNTAVMAAAECPAALRIRELTIDGFSDWYLPAIGELNAAAANVPELFDPKGWYWSSTQLSRIIAFAQDFEYGSSDWLDKGGELRVRAFRRIPLDLLTT